MLNYKIAHPSQIVPSFQAHVRAHEEVIGNEHWYGDDLPDLGKGFSVAETQDRYITVMEILLRAAKHAENNGAGEPAESYFILCDKLEACGPRHRCGSLACPRCARAFQKAKVDAQEAAIISATKDRSDKHLVFVTIIPKTMMFPPGQFQNINIKKANRWLKDALKPVGRRMMLGSADLGWETRRGGGYIQLHWHLAMWSSNPVELKAKLASIFPRAKQYERPVDATPAADLGFLPYMNKLIKWNDLLRRNRTHLPELLLVLDRTEPLDLIILSRLRVIAQEGGLALQPIGHSERRP
jgi:hypothetical protein